MRVRPLRGESMSVWRCVLGVCTVALTGIWLGGSSAASADGAACANATFRIGPSEHLPDCRAYEQVSPAEKGGLDAVTLQPLRPAQAAPCAPGEVCAFVYMNVANAFAGAQGNESPNAYLATRGSEGWQTTSLSPPTRQAPSNGPAKVGYAFSTDLSQAVVRVALQQLTEGAPAGVYNLFVGAPGGAYSLVTSIPPAEPPRTGCSFCIESEDVPAFAGASSDFSHILFEANDSLLTGAPGGGTENLYESAGGQIQLVGVLPDGAIAASGATAGGGIEAPNEHARELEHAISQDGSHVFFEAAADGGEPDARQVGDEELYDRLDGVSTVEVSAPAAGGEPSACETKGGVCNAEPAQFWAASADGSVVYFTSKASLTKGSFTGVEPTSGPEPRQNPGNDLYRFEVATDRLTDLTSDADEAADPSGANVLGVLGASEDGSYVYFVAEGHLAPGAASGQPNLYVRHETAEGGSTLSFIATLQAPSGPSGKVEEEELEIQASAPEVTYESDLTDWTSRPSESQAYVTPDGRHLAFMSVKPLTGYDNENPVTGEHDHEVFQYSAENAQLVCASCDASHARPLGSAFLGAKLNEHANTPFHQPRSLSDDGSRLFFSSPDPLVPGLSGGSVKVFEYENGSVQLISGTESGGEAVFLDASASGDDVFLATREQLGSADEDDLADVYDARVDGGLPGSSVSTGQCQGSTCQEPFSSAPSFPQPISMSFAGAGNLVPPPSLSRATRPSRAQLLHRALLECARLKSTRKRATCRAAAKRHYAPAAKRDAHHASSKLARSKA